MLRIMLLTAVSILFLAMVAEGPGVGIHCCPDNWIRHGNSCYLFIGTKETWMEAEQMCTARGSTLVAIETAEENAFVRGYLKVFAELGANMQIWIGGNDMEIEGTWKWLPSGEAVTFTDWGKDEPGGTPGEDCIILATGRDYHWADSYCHNQLSFMCEKTITNPVIG